MEPSPAQEYGLLPFSSHILFLSLWQLRSISKLETVPKIPRKIGVQYINPVSDGFCSPYSRPRESSGGRQSTGSGAPPA